ncbi:FimD/PapC N-terminal domain-containing protein, partial [Serratia quinivorans]|uniref:FimD/PapC N-terminal domain-containing protein n=1 Tax=Serratia quinivorans TaxID=137545 RepID=UPI0021B73744
MKACNKFKNKKFSKALLYKVLIGSIFTQNVMASEPQAEYYFNPRLLSLGGGAADAGNVDLSRFENGSQLPGTYRVDIYLNGQFMTSRDVSFVASEGKTLEPSLTLKEYRSLGLNDKAIPGLKDTAPDTALVPLSQ